MFDVDFCAQIGGYPKGSVLLSNDKTKKYTSLIDNNTSNFNVSVDPSKWVQSGLTETEVKAIAWGVGKTSAPWAPLASPALTGIPTAPTASTGTRSTQLATTAFVGAESQIAAPTGSVYTFAGSTVPTGWLKCNGALLSRTTYASLFAVIGTTYGAGDGSTTFALPDLRGEFVRGADDGRGVDAGRTLGAWQNHSMQRHNHYLPTSTGGGNSHFVIPDGAWGTSTPNELPVSNMAPAVTINADNNANLASGSAGNFSSETVPRNVAMHYIIKY